MNLREKARGISIRWKLALYFGIFLSIVLIVTWIFQVYLLDTFYEQAKEKEMTLAADELVLRAESDQLPSTAYRIAVDSAMSVSVYRINGAEALPLASVDATGGVNFPLYLETLETYYRLAAENGGDFVGHFGLGDYVVERPMLPFLDGAYRREGLRMVYIRLVPGEGDVEYLVILNSATKPLESIVQMLRTQFIWIVTILLLCGAVTVILLYRHISAPLVRMNEAAKQLAKGKYDTVFSGEGYLETRELAETLNYASRELSRLDDLQRELIANISHDLRTPLTMIKGYSEVMRDIPGENTPENVQVVIDETTRLSELVDDILDLSRIRAGARAPEYERIDLTQALHQTLARYDTLVRHKGYRIEVHSDCDAWVCADRGMLLQVLYNLINNAINYTGEDHRVTVSQTVADGAVRIGVTDTGEGIDPSQIPLIWDRYYKVDKTHKRAMIGTGLGLSIVKEILELHGATYGVESALGAGSTFWFSFPLAENEEKENNKEE